jgi:hypothetical protein
MSKLPEFDDCSFVSPWADWGGRLELLNLEGSNKMDRISFGGTPGISILSMNSICWNSNSPGQLRLKKIRKEMMNKCPGDYKRTLL